jgi:CDP-paratose 2-epimerase
MDLHNKTVPLRSISTCLITGGCGFVGSALALCLRRRFPTAKVIALDNFHRNGSRLNEGRLRDTGVDVVEADVRNRDALIGVGPCDLVIDAAAEPSVMAGRGDDVSYVVDTNLGGTLNALECARLWKARFIFLSTSRVYPVEALRAIRLREAAERFEIAADQVLPGISVAGIAEGFPVDGARTLYGATKFASEIMVREYAAQFGLDAVVNRCGVIAGPWQMGKVDQGVIALWVASHIFGKPLKYIGYDGRQVRDVLHIDDLATLIEMQVRRGAPLAGAVYTVGGGREISCSLRELTNLCRERTGVRMDISGDPRVRDGDVPLYITDAARVRVAFGWAPERSVRDVVADIAGWIQDAPDTLRPILAP